MLTSFLPALAAALDGAGPAVLPLPTGGGRRDLLAALDPGRPLERDDVALVVPTSGSTGEPKGAMLTADALQHSAAATHERIGGPGQWVLALPVTHVAGVAVLVRSLLARTRPEVVDLYGGFDVAAFVAATGRLAPGQRRYSALVPTQLARLLASGGDATAALRSYDAVLIGGAALTDGLRERATDSGVRLVTTYGMSETCGGCVYDGWPLDGVAVSVREDGRVLLAGPVVFSGYRLRPDLTAEALVGGRYVTQDIGRLASDGRLEVRGRADDMLVSGGENVPAGLVERVLGEHPAVAGVAVVGVPDTEWGQRVVAVVQAAIASSPPTLEDLRSYASAALAPAALPRELVVVGLLPMLASGKPDKAAVRSLVAARQ